MSSRKPQIKILLVRPDYSSRFSQWVGLQTEPLELEILAAVSTAEGCDYLIHDPVVTGKNIAATLKSYQPEVVAITGYYPARDRMLELAHEAKTYNKNTLVFMGGVHAELNDEDFQDEAVDLIIRSGGALTFAAILQAAKAETSLADIPGTICRASDGGWTRADDRPFNISELPLPDRSHFHDHKERFSYLHYGPTALIKTAYGCPFKCTFCYCRMLNNGRYVQRDLKQVVGEIKQIDCDTIWIVDDTFLFDVDQLRAFAEALKREGVKKRFIVYGRSEFIASHPESIPVLKEIGIVNVIIGFESIKDENLKAFNKENTSEQGRETIQRLKENGIQCTGLFIIDTSARHSDFSALEKWIAESGLDLYTLSIFSPYPGTEQYPAYRDQLTTTDCRKWDFSHLVMKPTHMSRPVFYFRVLWLHVKMALKNPALRRHLLLKLFRRGS
ncbi:MAG: radical SAM protein [Lentisphaeria bacterium]|nr:radical SAM protein [Lentisphaeria bacterium]